MLCCRLKLEGKDSNTVTFSFGDNKIVLQAKPFRLDLVSGTEPVMSVNAKGLLKFEHFRAKNQ